MASSKIAHIFTSVAGCFSSKDSKVGLETPSLILKVISPKFGLAIFEVQREDTGRLVKFRALEHYARLESFPFILHSQEDGIVGSFKMTRVKTRKEIRDFDVVSNLSVANNEEFMLDHYRIPASDPHRWYPPGPTLKQIQAATKKVPPSKPQMPLVDISYLLLDDDMRKVFITLAQECAYVLGTTPLADKLIKYFRYRMHYYIKHHENAIKVMTQLGFAKDKVEKAMKLKANNTRAALDWLIDNQPRPEIDENVFNSARSSNTPRSSLITSARRDSILSSSFEPTGDTEDRINGLLEIVKFYSDMDEIVYDMNIHQMARMGFDDEVAHEALRVTRNNIGAAVAHIQGESNPSITELRTGFSASSKIKQQFMESPEVQLSLSNPRSFLLYINILDKPSQANSWNPLSDIGELMTHIIITYHEEKHISATNQFNESRFVISALSAPN